MSGRDRLLELLRERSVARGDFVLASGRRSPYYIDARRTTMSAEGLALIGRLGLEAIRAQGWAPTAVGGLTMGADPVACAIAAASAADPGQGPPIHAFTVRKTAKTHGTQRRVEGNLAAGDPVVIVEDVITSGGSALQAIQAVQQEGGKVLGALVVVDRGEGGLANVEAFGVKIVALATTTDLGLPPISED